MYSYVIFDFDGTITDTSDGIVKSFTYSFEQMGREVPDLSDRNKFIGPPLEYSYRTFFGVSAEEAPLFLAKYRERYSVKGIYECELYEGIKELLSLLKEKGVKLGVASSKPERFVNEVADFLGVREFFDVIVGAAIGGSCHPTKKQLITDAMEKMGADDKDKCLMVGDRLYDIEGAKQVGIKSVGVMWGFGGKNEFIDYGADYIIEKTEELEKIVFHS